MPRRGRRSVAAGDGASDLFAGTPRCHDAGGVGLDRRRRSERGRAPRRRRAARAAGRGRLQQLGDFRQPHHERDVRSSPTIRIACCAIPSLRYLVHLTAPGFDAIGANEPFLPGVSVGHNGQDRLRPDDLLRRSGRRLCLRHRARRPHLSLQGRRRADPAADRALRGRGTSSRDLVLKFTRHGPIVHQSDGRAIAIRSVWFEPGAAPYARALTTMRAKTFDEFRDGVRTWGTPSVNHVCADISGRHRLDRRRLHADPPQLGWTDLPARGDGTLRMGRLSRQRTTAAHRRSRRRLCRVRQRDEPAAGIFRTPSATNGSITPASIASARFSDGQEKDRRRALLRAADRSRVASGARR